MFWENELECDLRLFCTYLLASSSHNQHRRVEDLRAKGFDLSWDPLSRGIGLNLECGEDAGPRKPGFMLVLAAGKWVPD